MKTLLGNQYVKHLNDLKSHIPGFKPAQLPVSVHYETTDAKSFDLIDKKNPNITNTGSGSVTYHNNTCRHFVAVNYEELLNSLPECVSKGIKRPDFIVYDESDEGAYFIINELSQGKPASKRSDAKAQMHSALKLLKEVKGTDDFISKRQIRLCIFSCRSDFPDTPDGIADAFGINGKHLQDMVEIKFQPITKAGFKAYETDVVLLV